MISSAAWASRVDISVENVDQLLHPVGSDVVYRLGVARSQIAEYARDGQDLLIHLTTGQLIKITAFFDSTYAAQLVLVHGSESFRVDFSWANGGLDGIIDAAVLYEPFAMGISTHALLGILGSVGAGILSYGAHSQADRSPFRGAAPIDVPTDPSQGPSPGLPPTIQTPTLLMRTPDGQALSDGQVTNVQQPVLTGVADPGANVQILDNGVLVGVVSADGQGQWRYELPHVLDDGHHEFKAVVVVGDVQVPGQGQSLDIDTVAPFAPTILQVLDDVGAVRGGVLALGQTDDRRPEISGKAEPDSLVSVFDGNVLLGTVIANASGQWHLTPVLDLREGAHVLTASAQDAAGNMSPISDMWMLMIDLTAPETSVEVEDVAQKNQPTVSGDSSERYALVQIIWPDGTVSRVTSDAQGHWSVTAIDVQPSGEIKVQVSDEAGNVSQEQTEDWIFVDRTAPDPVAADTSLMLSVIAGDDLINKDEQHGSHEVRVTVVQPPADAWMTVVTVYVGGQAYVADAIGGGQWVAQIAGEVFVDASERKVVAEVVFKDAAGNESLPISAERSYAVDVLSPDVDAAGTSLSIAQIAGDDVVNAAESAIGSWVPITLTLSQAPADAASVKVSVLIDGGRYVATSNGNGTWTASVPGSVLAAATTHKVVGEAVFTDAAGNVSIPVTGERSYGVDVAGPDVNDAGSAILIDEIAGDGVVNAAESAPGVTVLIQGRLINVPADANQAQIKVSVGGQNYVAIDHGDGTWSAVVSGEVMRNASTKLVSAQVVFTDVAGNTSIPVDAAQSYVVDAVGPSVAASGTQLEISTIAQDNVLNASEASVGELVLIRGVLKDVPTDAVLSIVTVMVDGTSYAATALADGSWHVEVPGEALKNASVKTVSAQAVFEDAAGNVSVPVDASKGYALDLLAPDTAGISIAIGVIAGDDILNAAENVASAQVPITMELSQIPSDAASTKVAVLLDGVRYQAVRNGDGSWTAQVPASTLATASSNTVTAEATFTDTAGNVSVPVTNTRSYVVDITPPSTAGVELKIVHIAQDDVVNLAESATGQMVWVTGTLDNVPGDARTTTLTLSLGDQTYAVTNLGDGTWQAQVKGSDLRDAASKQLTVSATFTDLAGNVSGPISDTKSYGVDVSAPLSPGHSTQVTITGVAGDGIVNIAESAVGVKVPVVVALSNVPADVANTTVHIMLNGQSYGATVQVDGTWVTYILGASLRDASSKTLTAKAVFADAAGNSSELSSSPFTYTVDVSTPNTVSSQLLHDTGTAGDHITSDGTVSVSGIESAAAWEYSINSGETWQSGTGSHFVVSAGIYASGQILVRQTDAAGNVSAATSPGAMKVMNLVALNDAVDVDLGYKLMTTKAPMLNSSVSVLGLTDTNIQTKGVPITISAESTGDLIIEVQKSTVLAVADALNIEVYDASGQRVYVAGYGAGPLSGSATGWHALQALNDGAVRASFGGLEPGDYRVVVRKGSAASGAYLDVNANGTSLQELDVSGISLGAHNKTAVLDAIKEQLDGSPPNYVLGSTLRSQLNTALNSKPNISASELEIILTKNVTDIGSVDKLSLVLSTVSQILISDALGALNNAAMKIDVIEHGPAYAVKVMKGNVVDPEVGTTGEAGEDHVLPGTVIGSISNVNGTSVSAGTSIQGLYGVLVLNANGSYTYTHSGNPASVGQTERFTYTLTDGRNTSQTAELIFTVDGQTYSNDTAQVQMQYENLVSTGVANQSVLTYGWTAILLGLPILDSGSQVGDTFKVDKHTQQDIAFSIKDTNLLSALAGGSFVVEQKKESTWVTVQTYNLNSFLNLLSNGQNGILINDLAEGEYRTRVSLGSVLQALGTIEVEMSSQITYLNRYALDNKVSAEGVLLENEVSLTGADAATLQVKKSTGLYEDVTTTTTLTGQYGTLTLHADGRYSYQAFNEGIHITGPDVDVFDYRVILSNGQVEQAQLHVTVTPVGIPQATSGNDNLYGTAQDDVLMGGVGNDILTGNGGSDVFRWKDLGVQNGTAGNGADTITDFTVGSVLTNANADVIDLSALLGQRAGAVSQYVQFTQSAGNTIISVDRDGTGSAYGFTPLITLQGVETNLEVLLNNQQLVA